MEELIANLEEDIDLLLYDSESSNIEKKIATDIANAIIAIKDRKRSSNYANN